MGKAKKLEILRRRERIYELHLQGKNQTQIAELTQVSQAHVNRDLQALQKEAISYVYGLAKGKISARFREVIDGISLAKKRSWKIYTQIDQSDTIEESIKAKLKLAALKVVITAEEARYKIIADAENVLNLESLTHAVSEIEQQYKEANR
jgi:hypothetical protein